MIVAMDVFARATALAGCTIFEAVPPAAILSIAERCAALRLATGEPLPLHTDAGDAVLLVATGRVRAGTEELGPGELVGEVAALDDDAAAPAAVALEPTDVVRIFRDDLLDLLAEHASAARALARALAARLRGAP